MTQFHSYLSHIHLTSRVLYIREFRDRLHAANFYPREHKTLIAVYQLVTIGFNNTVCYGESMSNCRFVENNVRGPSGPRILFSTNLQLQVFSLT